MNHHKLMLLVSIVLSSHPVLRAQAESEKTHVDQLRRKLKSSNAQVRAEAASTLGSLGDVARPASADIAELLVATETEVRAAAAAAILNIGCDTSTIPMLTRSLGSTDPFVRYAVVTVLGQLGAAAKAAEAGLTKLLSDSDLSVQSAAALSLWRVTGKKERTLEKLGLLLKSGDSETLVGAIGNIGAMGSEAKSIVGEIKRFLSNSENAVRYSACESLWQITKQPSAVLPTLYLLLDTAKADQDIFDARSMTLSLLADMKADAKEASPRIRKLLQNADLDLQGQAANAVWQIDRDAAAVLPVLDRVLGAKAVSPATRIRALENAGELGEKAAPLLSRIQELRQSKIPQVAAAAGRVAQKLQRK